MKTTLPYVLILLWSLLGLSAAYSVNPSHAINVNQLEKEHPNISFRKISTYDRYQLLVADIEPNQLAKKNVAILICYPDSGNIQKWLGYGMVLADKGYNVVMFDYRGFGGSDPFKIDRDTLYYDEYLTDAKAAFSYMFKTHPKCKLGVFGMSMGSIMATQLASTAPVDFVVGDAYVTDMDGIVANVERVFGKKVKRPSSAWDYKQTLYGIQQPMLVFSGKYDTICKSDNQHLWNSQSEMITYHGGYLEGPEALHSRYFDSIDTFIQKVTRTNTENRTTSLIAWAVCALVLAAALGRIYGPTRKTGAA